MNSDAINIRDLVVSYGDKVVIDGLNLDIKKGEFVGVIGPNGTGKSTLVKAITRIVDKKSGDIIVKGRQNTKMSKRHLAQIVAVVPQEFNIEYEFTNYDIVMMGRNPHIDRKNKIDKEDYEIVREAMEMTNTWQFRENLFNELSGGERQRVIVARAIAQQSEIILLDEPTSHLDIHHQLEVMELIHNLKEKKKLTVLAVLHDVNMAARFSDRLVLINDGKVVAQGTPNEVVTKQHLSKLYKMEMLVRENKILGTKEIVPLRAIKEKIDIRSNENTKIHVICGGGSGEEILERLNSLGFKVSVGVVNEGDSDWEICQILGIKCITAPPFCGVDEDIARENLEHIMTVDCVLVTDVPFGNGNLLNIEILKETDKPIFMYRSSREIDYTNGLATEILKSLEREGNIEYIGNYDAFVKKIVSGELL